MWTVAYDNRKAFDKAINKMKYDEIASNLEDLIAFGCGEWREVANVKQALEEALKQLSRLSDGQRTPYEQNIADKSGGPEVGSFAYEMVRGIDSKTTIELSPAGKRCTDRFYIEILHDDQDAIVRFLAVGHTRK